MSAGVSEAEFGELVALFTARRLDEAALLARTLLIRAPHAALVHGVLVSIEEARGDLAAAEASLAQAYRLAPDNPHISYNFGAFLLARGRAHEAIALLEHCLRRAPGHVHAACNLGVARLPVHELALHCRQAERFASVVFVQRAA
mgnify:CR=1 FL=1